MTSSRATRRSAKRCVVRQLRRPQPTLGAAAHAARAARLSGLCPYQAIDHVVKYMGEMKVMLYGDGGEKAPKEEEGRLLAVEAAKSKLLHFMCTQLSPLGFEARAARGARRRGGVRANARPLTVCVHGCADAQGRGAGVERAAPPRRGRHAARRGLPGEAPGPRRHARERARPHARASQRAVASFDARAPCDAQL